MNVLSAIAKAILTASACLWPPWLPVAINPPPCPHEHVRMVEFGRRVDPPGSLWQCADCGAGLAEPCPGSPRLTTKSRAPPGGPCKPATPR